MSSASNCHPTPREPETPLLTAVMTALEARDWLTAHQVCQTRLDTHPDDPDAYRYFGQIHSLLGKREAALQAAQQATVLAPHDPRTWSDLGLVQVRIREWTLAIQAFTRAVDLDSQYADGWHNLGTRRSNGWGTGLRLSTRSNRPY